MLPEGASACLAGGALAAAFDQYWREVPAALQSEAGVLAYELLNEPWVGDHIGHPLRLVHPALADNASLAPFYDAIAAGIAAIEDDAHIVAFSGAELGDRLLTRVGFEHPYTPAGVGHNRSALIVHDCCNFGTPVVILQWTF